MSAGSKRSTNYQINDHLEKSNEVWKITTSNYINHYCKVFKTGKSLARRFNAWILNAFKVLFLLKNVKWYFNCSNFSKNK